MKCKMDRDQNTWKHEVPQQQHSTGFMSEFAVMVLNTHFSKWLQLLINCVNPGRICFLFMPQLTEIIVSVITVVQVAHDVY